MIGVVTILLAVVSACAAEELFLGQNCASGWVKFGSSCYLFSKDFLNWFEAARNCREKGAHLVTVNDAAEHSFLSGYMLNPALQHYYLVPAGRTNANWPYSEYGIVWIGLTDLSAEGSWHWIDTDSAYSFQQWHNGEPNNDRGSEHCVHYARLGDSTLTWNDVNCNFIGTSICEMEM